MYIGPKTHLNILNTVGLVDKISNQVAFIFKKYISSTFVLSFVTQKTKHLKEQLPSSGCCDIFLECSLLKDAASELGHNSRVCFVKK